ncbi:MAG: hypothetical protein K0S51_1750 [Bacillales bacterium]|nr:hypothetical protein [Bacillales bacterium]
MLVKSVIVHSSSGNVIRINDVPVVNQQHPKYFFIKARLDNFINRLVSEGETKKNHSFKQHLMRHVNWDTIVELYEDFELKNNA